LVRPALSPDPPQPPTGDPGGSRVEGVADALAECLDLIRCGNDIEACLARFPAQAGPVPLDEVAEDRPLSQSDASSVVARRRVSAGAAWCGKQRRALALESRRDLRTLQPSF
jgi:hypothetical protein